MKVLAGIMLTFLLGAMFVSLFHMSSGMNMAGDMANCPSMTHDEVLCPMSLADHIGAWKSVFLALAPTITLLLMGAVALVLLVSIAPHMLASKLRSAPVLYIQLRERVYTFCYRAFQELFANGILHPKLF